MPEATLAADSHGHRIQAFLMGPTQHADIGGASAPITDAVGTSMVILHCDADCYVVHSADDVPVATEEGFPLDAGAYLFWRAIPGRSKFAFIQRSASDTGTAWVTEGN